MTHTYPSEGARTYVRGLLEGQPRRPPSPVLSPVDLTTWDDGLFGHESFFEGHPDWLDEPWPYRFKIGDRVWVCANSGRWYRGNVISHPKKGETKASTPKRIEIGLYWWTEFRAGQHRMRKWASPVNGEIKPDTEHTHRLMEDAGLLDLDTGDE